jgi:hypothetical protein
MFGSSTYNTYPVSQCPENLGYVCKIIGFLS